MGDNVKKHSRKSKLVERTYEEVEDTSEVKLEPNSRKRKTSHKPPETIPPIDKKPPIELSVNVEVEEGDEEWYRLMIEQESKEKNVKPKKNVKKKRNIIKEKIKEKEVLTDILIKKLPLDELDIKILTKGQGIVCVDSSYTINKQAKFYNYILTLESLFLSSYTAFFGPINYEAADYHKSRSHLVYSYYCAPCKLKCGGKHQFMTHLSSHSLKNIAFYVVSKFGDQSALICTEQPRKYLSDCVVADIGIGNIISIVSDYETAIKNVVTKWFRSNRASEVIKGILSYKCYSCTVVYEYYSQFMTHLTENHESYKLIITTEHLTFDYFINVVASRDFKPVFNDLTLIPNQSKYKCFKCKKVFDSYDSYRSHCKRVNVCAGCGIELTCDLMKLHEGSCNRFMSVFYPKICPCKRQFVSAREMTDHQLSQECKFGRTALVFICVVCNYLAPSTVKLLIHQRLEHHVRSDIIHTTFKISTCSLCREKYAGCYAHSHYCKKRQDIVDCSSCGMLFQNEYFLNIHLKAYPSSICSVCDEYFSESCAMIEHGKKVHGLYEDIEISYKCTTCNVFFDEPEEEGVGLQSGHVVEVHESSTRNCNIFSYKKIYMPKVMKGTFGYLTGMFPPQDIPANNTNTEPEDMEELIDVAVIKKSNIISKSSPNTVHMKPKKQWIHKPPVTPANYEYKIDLSKTINQEHNYDITHSETNDDGSYEIDKVTDDITNEENVDLIMENAKIRLLEYKRKHSTVAGLYNEFFYTPIDVKYAANGLSKDNNERLFKIEADNDCKTDIVIEAIDVYEDTKDHARNTILDSFSQINEDIIKCEPDAETMLVKTHVPVTFMGSDDAKPGCSKDDDFSIKSEAKCDDDSDYNTGDNYYNNDVKPLSPKYPEEIGFAPQNKTNSNLLFETVDKSEKVDSSKTDDKNKALKRKLNHFRIRKTKLQKYIETTSVLNEALQRSDDTTKSIVKSDEKHEQNFETQENNLKPKEKPKKPAKMRRKKRRLTMRSKPTKKTVKPFRGFEPHEIKLNTHKKIIKATENHYETTETDNNSVCTETTDTVAESSTADTVSIKSEMSDTKTDDDGKVTIKLEIKEEYEEYETDLIIFDEANLPNDSDEKFVEVNPKSSIKESPSKPKIYFCKRCQFTGHHKGYKDHINQCRKGLPKRVNKPSPKQIQLLKYNCIKCNLECDDLRDYLKHLPSHGYDDIHCPCCNEGFPMLNKLAEHVLRHIKADFRRICFLHLNNKPMELKKFRCSTCKMIVDQEDFFGHWQVHFDRVVVKKQPRDIRAAVLRAEYGDLARSMALEEGVKKEICGELQTSDLIRNCLLCNKQFTRAHDIKRHLIEHLTMDALCHRPSLRAMKCQICFEDFDYTDLYKRHMRDHASLPLYQCQICDKSFSDSSNFGKHKKVHDVFEFVCDICRRKFQSKITLVNHMLLHEKHKTITCDLCLKKFYFPSTFKKHMRAAHEKGIPKHSCTLCKTKFFSTKEQLNHEWREHGLRKTPMDCPLCDQGYRRIIDLKNHLKTVHAMPYFTVKNRKKVEDEFKVRGIGQEKIDLVFNRLCKAKGLEVSDE